MVLTYNAYAIPRSRNVTGLLAGWEADRLRCVRDACLTVPILRMRAADPELPRCRLQMVRPCVVTKPGSFLQTRSLGL
jgi:hypothetical protein